MCKNSISGLIPEGIPRGKRNEIYQSDFMGPVKALSPTTEGFLSTTQLRGKPVGLRVVSSYWTRKSTQFRHNNH